MSDSGDDWFEKDIDEFVVTSGIAENVENISFAKKMVTAEGKEPIESGETPPSLLHAAQKGMSYPIFFLLLNRLWRKLLTSAFGEDG